MATTWLINGISLTFMFRQCNISCREQGDWWTRTCLGGKSYLGSGNPNRKEENAVSSIGRLKTFSRNTHGLAPLAAITTTSGYALCLICRKRTRKGGMKMKLCCSGQNIIIIFTWAVS